MNNTSDSVILFKFWAPWCFPCKTMQPLLDNILTDHNEIKLVDINIDEDPDKAREYNIRAIPTLILKKGKEVRRLVGSANAEQVKEFLFQ